MIISSVKICFIEVRFVVVKKVFIVLSLLSSMVHQTLGYSCDQIVTLIKNGSCAGCDFEGADFTKPIKDLELCQNVDFYYGNYLLTYDQQYNESILSQITNRKSNLVGANMQSVTMPGIVFKAGSQLIGTILSGANLENAIFDGVVFGNKNKTGIYARGAMFFGANLKNAKFRGANLNGVGIGLADLNGADFTGATITSLVPNLDHGLSFKDYLKKPVRAPKSTNLGFGTVKNSDKAIFTNAKMQGLDLSSVNHLNLPNFKGAILDGADFSGPKGYIIDYANFEGASLIRANFSGRGCGSANFNGAHLMDANFNNTTFSINAGSNLTFENADFTGSSWLGANIGTNISLKTVRGLDKSLFLFLDPLSKNNRVAMLLLCNSWSSGTTSNPACQQYCKMGNAGFKQHYGGSANTALITCIDLHTSEFVEGRCPINTSHYKSYVGNQAAVRPSGWGTIGSGNTSAFWTTCNVATPRAGNAVIANYWPTANAKSRNMGVLKGCGGACPANINLTPLFFTAKIYDVSICHNGYVQPDGIGLAFGYQSGDFSHLANNASGYSPFTDIGHDYDDSRKPPYSGAFFLSTVQNMTPAMQSELSQIRSKLQN